MTEFKELLSKNRMYIMGLSMISIMLFHQIWVKTFPFIGFRFVGHFGVDVFLFVSGFGIVYSLQKRSTKDFYKRRAIRILPMCLFCGVIRYITYLIFPELIHGETPGWEVLLCLDRWYISALIVFYLLSPFLFNLIQKYNYYLIGVILVLSILGTYMLFCGVHFTWAAARFPAYCLGMYIALEKIRPNRKYLYWGLCFVIIAILYRAVRFLHLLTLDELILFIILSFGLPSLCFYLIQIRPLIKKLYLDKIITFFGKHSLELFLWHSFVYSIIYALNLTGATALTLGFIFSIIIAYISYLIVEYIQKSIKMK